MGRVLLIEGDNERRRLLKRALERRGFVVTGEAGSVPEVIDAVAAFEEAPTTILVGAALEGTDPGPIAELLKRTWPKATVLQEDVSPTPNVIEFPQAAGA